MADNVLIIALGSNFCQKESMARAKDMLRPLFGGNISFTKEMWTQPIGIVSDKFLNCLAVTHTSLGHARIEEALKKVETECGNTSQDRANNIVKMDIDILLLGAVKYHLKDWQRGYVKELLTEFEDLNQNRSLEF